MRGAGCLTLLPADRLQRSYGMKKGPGLNRDPALIAFQDWRQTKN